MLGHLRRWAPWKRANRLRLPSVSYAKVVDNEEIRLLEPVDRPGGLTLEELAILVSMVRRARARRFFEIGSFRGRTSINVLYNCPEVVLTTLDLPLDITTLDADGSTWVAKDKEVAFDPDRGYFFEKYGEMSGRATRLFGDSATYDLSELYGRFDFVFIDGNHSFDYVTKDSTTAVRLLGPDGGVIVWHDYSVHPDLKDVVKAVELFAKRNNAPLRQIKRTKFAFVEVGGCASTARFDVGARWLR